MSLRGLRGGPAAHEEGISAHSEAERLLFREVAGRIRLRHREAGLLQPIHDVVAV